MRFLNWLRWPLLPPVVLAVGYLTGGLIHLIYLAVAGSNEGLQTTIGYPAAFLSGLIHVWATLFFVYMIAPAYKKMVVVVIGVFLMGDLAFVHLVLPELMADSSAFSVEESGIGIILSALRVGDYDALIYGGFTKLAGALAACYFVWWRYFRRE